MKITLKSLIQEVPWVEIEEKLFLIYPEEEDSLHFYKRLYWELSNLEPEENTTEKIIEFELFDEEDEVFYEDIEVIYTGMESDSDFELGLSDEQWKKILGYYISENLLEELDKAEVIVHAFVEATYGGFSEAETFSDDDIY